MAYTNYLALEGEALPLPVSYSVSVSDVEASSSGETEAGTTQRDVVRTGVAEVSAEFQVTPKWLSKLSAYRDMPKISAEYMDTGTLEMREAEMYMDGFKCSLKKDTPRGGMWTVSFTLREM